VQISLRQLCFFTVEGRTSYKQVDVVMSRIAVFDRDPIQALTGVRLRALHQLPDVFAEVQLLALLG